MSSNDVDMDWLAQQWQVTSTSWLSPRAVAGALGDYAPGPGHPSLTLYLPSGRWGRGGDGWHDTPPTISAWLADKLLQLPMVEQWSGGLVLFLAPDRSLLVLPPFDPGTLSMHPSWQGSMLLESLERQYTIGVVLVRLGRYAVAVLQGHSLVVSKTDTRYVKGRHHAGGTSQLRYQRIREKQAREMLEEACSMAQDRLGPYGDRLDYLALGGERHTLLALQERCPFLSRLGVPVMPRRLDVRVPNQRSLEGLGNLLYQSRVVVLDSTP